jgi:hypothetical protein
LLRRRGEVVKFIGSLTGRSASVSASATHEARDL